MLKAAIVGVGFMGWIHYLAYQRCQAAKLVAFASRDPKKRLGDWRGIRGNFGPPGEQIDVAGMTAYDSFESMLTDDSIDLIDICLPPNLHVEAACQALQAGKHVLCEKPLGLTTQDCDTILAAAEKADRRVMVAQVLPYMGEFQFAYQAATRDEFGRPLRGYFKRIISPPDWIPDFYDPSTVGGPLIDLHVHDAHFIRLLFGMPKRVLAVATMRDGIVKFCHTVMEFGEPGVIVGTSSGVSDQTARPFCHGFEIQFQDAVAQFELSALTDGADVMPLRVLKQDGSSLKPTMPEGDEISAFAAEIDDAARSVAGGIVESRLHAGIARDAIHICQCLQRSAESGQWVDCR
ncbi:MAG: Gfo/Idh/MocA family oxidoreductase [Planctomycetales bacterium]|nr:Gfo/Idh/MocA family oxidoreductase [Planctomycetales bacterium]